jgi:hypothetical protein
VISYQGLVLLSAVNSVLISGETVDTSEKHESAASVAAALGVSVLSAL